MKSNVHILAFFFAATLYSATPPAPEPGPRLQSGVYEWDKMSVTPNALGARRSVFDGNTTTVEQLHCHITTLNPGERSGAPRKHLQEEIIIVKDGTVEANWDGQSKAAGAGSVIFFASGATTYLRTLGNTPATYIVLYYITPLTPKN